MSFITESDIGITGIAHVDVDHLRLANIIAKMHHELTHENSRETLVYYAEELHTAIMKHFSFEEYVMDCVAYPLLEQHHQEHRTLLHEFEEFMIMFRLGDQRFLSPMLIFLKEWFIRHTNGSDHTFGEYHKNPNAPLT